MSYRIRNNVRCIAIGGDLEAEGAAQELGWRFVRVLPALQQPTEAADATCLLLPAAAAQAAAAQAAPGAAVITPDMLPQPVTGPPAVAGLLAAASTQAAAPAPAPELARAVVSPEELMGAAAQEVGAVPPAQETMVEGENAAAAAVDTERVGRTAVEAAPTVVGVAVEGAALAEPAGSPEGCGNLQQEADDARGTLLWLDARRRVMPPKDSLGGNGWHVMGLTPEKLLALAFL